MSLFYYSCENTITNSSNILDCNNVLNGSASIDDCGLCTGGTTIFESNYLMDCEGECGGSAVEDCAGTCNGSAVLDDYGCCGDNSTCMVINEINYNSSLGFDLEDWVELHNYSDSSINIGNWKLKDDDDDNIFTIPENTILSAGDYIVLCENAIAFSSAFTILFPEVTNYIGDLGFGLKIEGDQVRLFDSNGSPIDSVKYDDIAPWPTGPDGTWPTLELIHPSRDNTLGENWDSSTESGTPGAENSVYVDE